MWTSWELVYYTDRSTWLQTDSLASFVSFQKLRFVVLALTTHGTTELFWELMPRNVTLSRANTAKGVYGAGTEGKSGGIVICREL